MPETLLSPSGIKLFGREVQGLELKAPKGGWDKLGIGCNQFLKEQLSCKGARLARIYGFTYEGTYYDMPRAAIFLVHNEGEKVLPGSGAPPAPVGRTNVDTSGVAARDWEFSEDDTLRRWDYDKGDFSLRLDVDTGPLEQILLAAVLRGGAAASSGMDLRSGMDLKRR